MDPIDYFKKPLLPDHRNYEALKAFYCDGLGSSETAEKYGLSPAYFKKLRHLFLQNLKKGINPFFSKKKPGPKKRSTSSQTIELIVALRKRNYSITDIKVFLDSKGKAVSLDTIDKVLKDEGFAPLPKRTRMERLAVSVPGKIDAPKSVSLELTDEKFVTEHGAGPLVFLPLMEKLGVAEAIKSLLALVAQDPSTGNLSYTNAELKHRNQSDAVFDFDDFWKQGR